MPLATFITQECFLNLETNSEMLASRKKTPLSLSFYGRVEA